MSSGTGKVLYTSIPDWKSIQFEPNALLLFWESNTLPDVL